MSTDDLRIDTGTYGMRDWTVRITHYATGRVYEGRGQGQLALFQARAALIAHALQDEVSTHDARREPTEGGDV